MPLLGVLILGLISHWGALKGKEVVRYLVKPLLIPLIFLFYYLNTGEFNPFIGLALGASWWGDIFLIWRERKPFFLLGLFMFLLAHLCFITAFVGSLGTVYYEVPVWHYALLMPYILLGVFFLNSLEPYLKKMKWPVGLYTAIIILMSYTALLRFNEYGGVRFWCPFLGSLLFILSDSLIAWIKFRGPFNGAILTYKLCYVFAQLLIVIGFL